MIYYNLGILSDYLYDRKEEGVLTNPTFHVSVIFGKRDEVSRP